LLEGHQVSDRYIDGRKLVNPEETAALPQVHVKRCHMRTPVVEMEDQTYATARPRVHGTPHTLEIVYDLVFSANVVTLYVFPSHDNVTMYYYYILFREKLDCSFVQ